MQAQHPPSVVRSYSSRTFGRCISNVGVHHFVVDHAVYQDGPGEQPGPIDYFLSGVTSCGVLMLERQARIRRVPLESLEVRIEGVRRETTEDAEGPATFKSISIRFDFTGPTEAQVRQLVDYYKRH